MSQLWGLPAHQFVLTTRVNGATQFYVHTALLCGFVVQLADCRNATTGPQQIPSKSE